MSLADGLRAELSAAISSVDAAEQSFVRAGPTPAGQERLQTARGRTIGISRVLELLEDTTVETFADEVRTVAAAAARDTARAEELAARSTVGDDVLDDVWHNRGVELGIARALELLGR